MLANDAPSGDSIVGDAYADPGVGLTYKDGQRARGWLTSGTHTASIAGDDRCPPVERRRDGQLQLARARLVVPNVLKPDLSAPGVDILAAFATPATNRPATTSTRIESGTSMASPHTAGAARSCAHCIATGRPTRCGRP